MPTPVLKIDKRTGNYCAYWSEGRRSKRKSMGTSDYGEAKLRFGHWLILGGQESAAVNDGNAPISVAELWTIYKDQHVDRNMSAPQTADYSWKNLKLHFSVCTLDDIDEGYVEKYVNARMRGDIGRPANKATVRRELSVLVACLKWHAAPARGRRRLVAPDAVPYIELPPSNPPKTRWLTSDEIEKIFATEMTPRLRVFLHLALETAARRGAIEDLTWDRVDFESGVIDYVEPDKRQTRKRRVAVPMSDTLRPVLEAVRKSSGKVLPPGGAIWPMVQTAVRRAGLAPPVPRGTGKAAKATGISPHTLRHTAATHMARRGVPLYMIAGVLGDTLATVERVYAKHCPDRMRAAVNAISGRGMAHEHAMERQN